MQYRITWIIAVCIGGILYHTWETPLVKDFITWAKDAWQFLGLIVFLALAVSGFIIKHNFCPRGANRDIKRALIKKEEPEDEED